eukprot:m.181820 g.181820  ORF g.181820 m.181820 type:complete len:719 (+) comp15520_c0_seq1:2017-4173(+)
MWQYRPAGDIDSVLPSSGQAGTIVDITGNNLLAGGTAVAVSLAGVPVTSYLLQSDTLIRVVASFTNNSIPLTGNIIIVADTGGVTTRLNGWTYVKTANITQIKPSQGQRGTRVSIYGTSLLGGGTSITNGSLAGVPFEGVVKSNNTVAIVIAGSSSSAGVAGDVVISANTGARAEIQTAWTYLLEGNITGISPPIGQEGTKLTITGKSLRGGGTNIIQVTLGGVPAQIISENDTEVVVIANAGAAGLSHVLIESDTGSLVSLENGWRYAEAGIITSISPTSGQLDTLVTVRGVRLRGQGSNIVNVALNGVPGRLVFENDVSVIFAAGSSVNASGNVLELTANSGAVVRLADSNFTYLVEGNVTRVYPASGQQGTIVTLTGDSLRGGGASMKTVTIKDVDTQIISDTDTSIVVKVGNATQGFGDILLESSSGAKVVKRAGFEYLTKGVIRSVTPSSGQKGTRVTLQGTGLHGGGSSVEVVSLFGVNVTSIEFENDTMVVVRAGQSNATNVSGTVTTLADTGAENTKENSWQYVEEGQITDVSPTSGQLGTIITLRGSNLLGYGNFIVSASVANNQARILSGYNDTFARVEVTSNNASSGTVTLIADNGAIITSSIIFSLNATGEISLVSPARGQVGTIVAIHGTNLLGTGGSALKAVYLAGVQQLEVQSSSSTLIRVRAGKATSTGLGDVQIVSNSGSIVEKAHSWTYDVPSNITAFCM